MPRTAAVGLPSVTRDSSAWTFGWRTPRDNRGEAKRAVSGPLLAIPRIEAKHMSAEVKGFGTSSPDRAVLTAAPRRLPHRLRPRPRRQARLTRHPAGAGSGDRAASRRANPPAAALPEDCSRVRKKFSEVKAAMHRPVRQRLRQAPSARTMSSAATKLRSLRQGRECHGPRVAGQACDRDWW